MSTAPGRLPAPSPTRLAGLLVLGTALLSASLSPAPARAARTIATTDGPILAYAADDGRMAWITFQRASKCYGVVHRHVLRTGADIELGRLVFGSQCGYDNVSVALAGSRVLWSWFWWPCDCMSSRGKVVTRAPGQQQRVVQELAGFNFNDIGDWLVGMVGDGQTLAYGTISTDYLDSDEGTEEIVGGSLRRVAGRSRLIQGAGFPSALSVNGTRIAVVNAGDAGGRVGPLENGPVHIRAAMTGDPIATIMPTGFPRAIALGSQRVALMVEKGDGSRHLEIYDADSGLPVTSHALSAEVAWEVDLDRGRVVYRRGKVIRIVEGGQSRVLAVTAAAPIGLSIEGRRVTWAENLNGRGRVRSVLVSDSS